MHYVLTTDHKDHGAMIMFSSEILDREEISLDSGQLIKRDVPAFDIHMDKKSQGEVLDFVWCTISGLIISQKFRQTLEDSGVENIQYFPVRIINDLTGEIKKDYFAANIVGLVSCLDWEASKLTRRASLPDKIRSIEEMHLVASKIKNHKIFRLAERSSITIVSQGVRDAARAAGLRGCDFVPAEGYSTT